MKRLFWIIGIVLMFTACGQPSASSSSDPSGPASPSNLTWGDYGGCTKNDTIIPFTIELKWDDPSKGANFYEVFIDSFPEQQPEITWDEDTTYGATEWNSNNLPSLCVSSNGACHVILKIRACSENGSNSPWTTITPTLDEVKAECPQ